MNNLILTDRSRIEADQQCHMERYWLTEYAGRGIVPSAPALPLLLGTIIHHGLQHMRSDHPWEHVIKDLDEELATLSLLWGPDQELMAEGLVKAFHKRVLPMLLHDYDIVAIEQELDFEAGGVIFQCRPDLLVRDKRDGSLIYPDFKTFTKWDDRQWDCSLQQHLTMKACEQATGEPVRACLIQGLSKGYKGKGGVLHHPLVYFYQCTSGQYVTRKVAGSKKLCVTDYPGGMDRWVQDISGDVIAKIFPRSQPIFPSEFMQGRAFDDLLKREQEIAAARRKPAKLQHLLFSTQTRNCLRYGGYKCNYFDLCRKAEHQTAPLDHGYKWREPHHALEQQMTQEKG